MEYGVNELIMTPISGINRKVTEVESIEEAISLNPELTVVFVDENGEEDLSSFEHPENAIYVVGRASYSPLKQLGGKSVKINTPTDKGRLWGHQAICIILQDRYDSLNIRQQNNCTRI